MQGAECTDTPPLSHVSIPGYHQTTTAYRGIGGYIDHLGLNQSKDWISNFYSKLDTVASQLTINYIENNVFCSYWPFFAKKTIFGSISITRVEKLFEKVSSLRRRVMALEQADRQIGPVIHGIYLS